MKILLSAYACEPDKGSEPGIGWNWATELAAQGHDVWVLTRANNRRSIEEALARHPLPRVHFVFLDLPPWALRWKKGLLGIQIYYLLWQALAFREARMLMRRVDFDLAHHITFGVYRWPPAAAFLGLPLIFGPLGGGDTIPARLRASFPIQTQVYNAARNLANWLAMINPLMWTVYQRAELIICKTEQTKSKIPRRFHHKCHVQSEIGLHTVQIAPERQPDEAKAGLRVLFVGRLVSYKAPHFCLRAFAKLLEVTPGSRLTMIGNGPDEARLIRLAERLDIRDAVDWVPWMPREDLLKRYADYDVLLFPSLQDSSGNVVLEALSQGLPVVCMKMAGPALMVDETCGRAIDPDGVGEDGAVARLEEALIELAQNRRLLAALTLGATRRARHYRWPHVIGRIYGQLGALGGQTSEPGTARTIG